MQHAMLYPEPAKIKRKGSGSLEPKEQGFSAARLSQARQVLAHSRELAEAVRDGIESLDDALKTVKQRQNGLKTAEEQLAELRVEAADLAEMVDDERMPLTEAVAALEQRKKDEAEAEQNKRETILRVTESAYQATVAWANKDFSDETRERLAKEDFRSIFIDRLRIDPSSIDNITKGAKALTGALRLLKLKRRSRK